MIINSLLDTGLYQFTMMQVVRRHSPGAQVQYRFKWRNAGVDLVPCVDEIRKEVGDLCALRFSERELDYLRALRFIKSDFVDFLALFQLNTKYIQIGRAADRPGEIEIVIPGPCLHPIRFEIPVLPTITTTSFLLPPPPPDF